MAAGRNGTDAAGGAECAFRRYAGYGFHRRKLKVFEVYESIRGCTRSEDEALDMIAVYDTLRLLKLSGRGECAQAVSGVYFIAAGRRPRKNEITYRVRRLAYESNYDDRSVYRQLQRAKEVFYYLRRRSEDI